MGLLSYFADAYDGLGLERDVYGSLRSHTHTQWFTSRVEAGEVGRQALARFHYTSNIIPDSADDESFDKVIRIMVDQASSLFRYIEIFGSRSFAEAWVSPKMFVVNAGEVAVNSDMIVVQVNADSLIKQGLAPGCKIATVDYQDVTTHAQYEDRTKTLAQFSLMVYTTSVADHMRSFLCRNAYTRCIKNPKKSDTAEPIPSPDAGEFLMMPVPLEKVFTRMIFTLARTRALSYFGKPSAKYKKEIVQDVRPSEKDFSFTTIWKRLGLAKPPFPRRECLMALGQDEAVIDQVEHTLSGTYAMTWNTEFKCECEFGPCREID